MLPVSSKGTMLPWSFSLLKYMIGSATQMPDPVGSTPGALHTYPPGGIVSEALSGVHVPQCPIGGGPSVCGSPRMVLFFFGPLSAECMRPRLVPTGWPSPCQRLGGVRVCAASLLRFAASSASLAASAISLRYLSRAFSSAISFSALYRFAFSYWALSSSSFSARSRAFSAKARDVRWSTLQSVRAAAELDACSSAAWLFSMFGVGGRGIISNDIRTGWWSLAESALLSKTAAVRICM